MAPPRIPLAERFWDKVHKTETCWEWTGSLSGSGYGQLGRSGHGNGIVLAHRVSWTIHYPMTPLTPGICVCHHCDNRVCIRPDHLFLGTTAENTLDMVAKMRHKAPRGACHWAAKLNEKDVAEIRDRLRRGQRGVDIAAHFSISPAQVSSIKLNQSWSATMHDRRRVKHQTEAEGGLTP